MVFAGYQVREECACLVSESQYEAFTTDKTSYFELQPHKGTPVVKRYQRDILFVVQTEAVRDAMDALFKVNRVNLAGYGKKKLTIDY